MFTFRLDLDTTNPAERYDVGYYKTQNEPGGGPWQRFIVIASCATAELAVALIHYLNGGPNLPPMTKYSFI
jgi:hypothetical protein